MQQDRQQPVVLPRHHSSVGQPEFGSVNSSTNLKKILTFADVHCGFPRHLVRKVGIFMIGITKNSKRLEFFRHTHATLLLQQGVHPKTVSERLGHSSVGITLDLYSHMVPGMQAAAAHKIDRATTDADSKKIASADNKKWPRTRNTPRSLGPIGPCRPLLRKFC